MKRDARFMSFGLLALAVGCGSTPQEDASEPPAQVQASPAQDMPSEQELAATASSAPVRAVSVRYVVDPSTTTQRSVPAGAQKSRDSSPSESLAPGAVRRSLR